jgi:hypothetical protein
MKFLRRHWYSLGLLAGSTALFLAFLGDLSRVQQILLRNFVVLTIHQFEEYGWPGGGPWIMNEVMQPSDRPDRYPLNQNNAFFINVAFAWPPFYLLPVFYPQVVWMGLAPVLIGFAQFVMHGVIGNIQMKSIYNPGLAGVVFGHVPLGVWYIVEAYRQGTITGRDWLFAALYMAAFGAVFMQAIGYKLLGPKDSPYPFAPEEMARFDRERRLARIGR